MNKNSNKVVARLTINRADGSRLIIEVHNDSTFAKFYHYFRQTGNRRSTKTLVRTKNRNAGLSAMEAYHKTPGLEVLADRILSSNQVFCGRDGQEKERNPVVSMKLRIIRKRLYQKVLHAPPVGMPVVNVGFRVKNPGVGILLLLPTRRAAVQAGE